MATCTLPRCRSVADAGYVVLIASTVAAGMVLFATRGRLGLAPRSPSEIGQKSKYRMAADPLSLEKPKECSGVHPSGFQERDYTGARPLRQPVTVAVVKLIGLVDQQAVIEGDAQRPPGSGFLASCITSSSTAIAQPTVMD